MQLLEEKHKEEVRLCHIQLTQAQRHINDLQEKCMQQKEYKANIAEKLQKVMEAQWYEAVRILNSGRSPGLPQDANLTLDQINLLKSRSYNNLEQIVNGTERDVAEKKYSNDVMDDTASSAGGEYEDARRNIDHFQNTPVTSKQPRSRNEIENDLQRYINLVSNILNKIFF